MRERIEGLVLRTTMITGFPGETEDAVRRAGGVRPRSGASSGWARSPFRPSRAPPPLRLDGQLPEDVRQARRDRLMAAQQEIAFAWNAAQVGRQWDVLIDGYIPGEKHAYIGRSYADAPEIDGAVYVTGERLTPGRIVPCEIVAARDYDLIGVAVGPPR